MVSLPCELKHVDQIDVYGQTSLDRRCIDMDLFLREFECLHHNYIFVVSNVLVYEECHHSYSVGRSCWLYGA